MTLPVPGHGVGTPYGKPGSWAAGYHTGNDYPAPQGATVVATRTGKVTKAQYDGDYGNRIEILTEGIEHSYSHLSKMLVSVGSTISEGQKIGEVGSTGNSTGPHLHYEERHDPYGYSDDRKPQFDGGGSSPTPPPSGGEYPTPTSNTVYLSKLRYGQEDSDSVWYLQRALNGHPLDGGEELPLTGNYFAMTDEEVRLCQGQHLPPADPVNASYVGPKQANHLFAGSGLTIVDDS
jgi:murein DD-endopeptidase MepM/ murein hydrolase activator NlpD